MKDVVLSVFPNKFVWLVGVDVESVLPCRSDPLGRHGDESEHRFPYIFRSIEGTKLFYIVGSLSLLSIITLAIEIAFYVYFKWIE